MTLAHSVGSEIDGSTPPTDAELVLAVRAGDRQAYGTLYERHLAAARAHASERTRSSADADEAVAEAFAKVFAALRAGHGPDRAFRAYLLTTVRNGLYERMRRDRRLELSDDMTKHDQALLWSDPVEAELNASLVARAFCALPERWQIALWRSEVEQRSLAEIGEGLGLRPNAVAALTYRAREGLRQAYLQAHLAEDPDETCGPAMQRLGGWTRGKLSSSDAALVGEHLVGCDRCRRLAAELADVNGGIRGLLVPLAVAGTAAGYSSSAVGVGAVGVAAAGAAVGAAALPSAATTGAGSVLGSALGWLLGTQGGQVATAVLTAVVVGGTAVATGASVTDEGGRGPTTTAVAAVSADGGGSTSMRTHPNRLIPQRTSAPEKGKPPSGKPSDGKSPKFSKGKSSKDEQSQGKQPQGKPSGAEASKKPSKSGSSSSQATSSSTASSSKKSAAAEVKGKPTTAKAGQRARLGPDGH